VLDDAAGAPYVNLSVSPDALVFSPHKMKGGQGCPGVLISSPTLFESTVPYVSGGGTVRFVCKHGAEYSKKIETRESGGSPNVVGIAKLGLVLKHIKIQKMSDFKKINTYMAKRLLKMKHIKLAVPDSAFVLNRLPVWSFIVSINDEIIHYNLIVAILNDMFGIQSRGGISCASFYAQRIFGMRSITLKKLDEMFGNNCSEYGWVRISLTGTTSKKIQRFICDAISQLPELVTKYKKFYKYDRLHNRFVFRKK
jgi:selenocysteine lyase/cysteine desulfurase